MDHFWNYINRDLCVVDDKTNENSCISITIKDWVGLESIQNITKLSIKFIIIIAEDVIEDDIGSG